MSDSPGAPAPDAQQGEQAAGAHTSTGGPYCVSPEKLGRRYQRVAPKESVYRAPAEASVRANQSRTVTAVLRDPDEILGLDSRWITLWAWQYSIERSSCHRHGSPRH